jgi:hypothetical protein
VRVRVFLCPADWKSAIRQIGNLRYLNRKGAGLLRDFGEFVAGERLGTAADFAAHLFNHVRCDF